MTAIRALPAVELDPLASSHFVDHRHGNTERIDDVGVHLTDAARRNGAHREFFMTRDAELANNEDVVGHAESASDLPGHRHTAPRQPEHDDIVPVCVRRQGLS